MATTVPPPSNATLQQLEDAARTAAQSAYAPYSGFHVGAALLADDGRIFTAANVENASYGLSLCAETNAIAAAAVAGVRSITAIAVVGYPAAAHNSTQLAFPCGRCRQLMAEFGDDDMVIRVAPRDPAAGEKLTARLSELLPHSFGPNAL